MPTPNAQPSKDPKTKPADQTPAEETQETPPDDPEPAEEGEETPPEGDPKPEPLHGRKDPLLAALFNDVEPEQRQIDPVEEEPTETAPEGEGDKPKDTDKQPEDKPKKKKKAVILKEPDVTPAPEPPAEPEPEPTPEPAKPQTQEPPKDPDADYIATLSEEQREELAEAEWAEKNIGEKSKGHRKRLIEFFRQVDGLATKDPNRTLDSNDSEFQDLLKKRPAFDRATTNKIIRGMATEKVKADLKTENDAELAKRDSKLEEIEIRQKRQEAKPRIDSVVAQFGDGVHGLMEEVDESADEVSKTVAQVSKLLRENKTEELEEFTGEAEHIRSAVERGKALAEDYTLFANRLVKFNKDNEQHKWLLDFIEDQGAALVRHGGKALARGGKTFLPRMKFGELQAKDPKQAEKYWTFSHRDVLEMLAINTRDEAASLIKQESEWAKKRGYAKAPKKKSAETPKSTEDPKPTNGPKAKPSPSKGPGTTKGQPAPRSGIDIVAIQGLRD